MQFFGIFYFYTNTFISLIGKIFFPFYLFAQNLSIKQSENIRFLYFYVGQLNAVLCVESAKKMFAKNTKVYLADPVYTWKTFLIGYLHVRHFDFYLNLLLQKKRLMDADIKCHEGRIIASVFLKALGGLLTKDLLDL